MEDLFIPNGDTLSLGDKFRTQ